MKPTKIFFAAMLLFLIVGIGSVSAAKTWNGSSSNSWNTAANWTPSGVPGAGDDVIIDINATISVNANPTINTLTITNNATVSFTSSGAARIITIDNTGSSIDLGSSLALQGSTGTGTRSMSIVFTGTNRTMSIAGILKLINVGGGSSYVATNSLTSVSGSIINDGSAGGSIATITSTASNLSFLAGGIYQHALNGGTIPTATWATTSTCLITGVTATIPTAASFAQSFGNFTWNCAGQSSGTLSLAGNLSTINGDLKIINTNALELRLINSGGSETATIGGNLEISGGILDLHNSNEANTTTVNIGGSLLISSGTLLSGNTNSPSTINFTGANGQFTYSGGTFTTTYINFNINNGASLTLNNALSVSTGRTFNVLSGGILNAGTNIINGAGAFTLNSGAGIITAHAQGLSAIAGTGSIQATGTKTYNSAANYTYNGTSAQVTGNVLTTAHNLTISNSAGVTLSNAITVNNSLSITAGSTLASDKYQITGNVTGAMTMEAGAILTLGQLGQWGAGVTFPSNFTKANISLDPSSTVVYQDYNSQTVSGVPNYANLTLIGGVGANNKQASSNTTINGTLTINANTVCQLGYTMSNTISIGGQLINNGTLEYDIYTGQTVNVSGDLSGSGTISMTGATGGTHILNLYGQNNAIGTLTTDANASTVNYGYTGAGNQQVFASPNYRNLTISGGGIKVLQGASTVNSTFTLTSGILNTTSSNILSITNTATGAIVGGSNTAFVNGPINWALPNNLASGSTYNFPVGNTSYLPFSLINPTTGATGPVMQVQAYNADAGASATFDAVTLSSISHNEYWTLNVVSGNFTNSSISVGRQTTDNISPLDAIAGSTAQTGSYSYLGGTTGTSGITNSNSIDSKRYFVLARALQTINTGAIVGSPFCAGSTVSVSYTITGTFTSGNIFTAQLSNTSGSFSSPVTIGTLTSTTSGTIIATIPTGTAVGSGYRIRVISSNPAKTGTDNGSNLTIVAIPGAPTTTGANICIGAPAGASATVTLSASGAGATDKYRWYDAASSGNLLKTSTDNTDNTFTTPSLVATTNYWVSILNTGGCEGSRIQVTANYPSTSGDDQSAAGTDSWIGHVYDGTNSGVAYNGTFANYYGHYTKAETFDENFGGDATCFNITSNSTTQSIYTETFSVRYRMNSTKRGLYTVNMGSDDGNRLAVDGALIYADWGDHGVNDHTNVLMNLTGSSSLVYDYYENGGGNRVYFNTLTKLLDNNLNANTSQSIYIGNSGTAISGDTYGTLPTGVTLNGTGYQWTYSTTPNGTRTTISGATGATYTPSTTVAPFNVAGTYYVFRNAILSSTNNVSPNPYVATNESNMATLIVRTMPTITTSVSTLSGFTYPVNNGPSAAQTFTVSGTGLLTNIDVSMPINSNYELSTDGINYSAGIIVLINAGGVASATTVYVRLKAGLAVNASYPDVITASSIDATSKTVTLAGSVTSQPSITVTPNSLTGLSYVLGYGPSTAQSFTVTGSNLQSNITVTAPTDFEIATSQGGTYYSSLTLTQSSGSVSATLWVRLIAGLSTSTYNENVTLTSTSAANKTVNCQGVVNRATLNVSMFTLAGFIYTFNYGPSSTQTFTVNGSSLSANIAIAATTNFEISSNGSTWTSGSLTLTQSGGVVNTTTIYVRMKAGHAVGIISPENIIITTTNAITQSVACSGAVTSGAATISSNPTLNGFFYVVGHGPSVTQSFTVSGTSLTSPLTITAPTDFEISSSGTEGTFTNTFSVALSGGKVNAALVYIRLKAGLTLTPGTWNETVILSSSGASDVSVSCNGKVVAQPTIAAGPSKPYNVCSGSSAALTSSGTNISSQSWTGPNNFTSTDQNPVLGTVTATNSGDYTVTGNVASGINLLTNGDFESGNTGFGSTYTYNAAQGTYSAYWIYNNPNTANPTYFMNGADHTPSGTLMMIVDGSETSGAIVWSETVSVNPNTNYQFSYWAENINSQGNTNYAHLQLYVNNVPVGPVNTASLTSWVQYLCNINPGSSTSLQLTIINTFIGGSGNDFALDDIVLEQVFQVSDVVTLNVNPTLTPSVSIAASANPTTNGATVTFTATPTNGGPTPTYVWYKNNTIIDGATSSTYSYIPANGDQLKCVMTTSISCYTSLTATSTTITMAVNSPTNLWKGSTGGNGTDWGTASNWTGNFVPNPGNDIIFATAANNNNNPAVNDLVLDQDRTQGSLVNQTTKNLIIPAGKRLTINNTITTDNSVDRIYIMSSTTNPNGSLIFYSNNPVYGTVEMYSMASKGTPITVPNPFPPYGTITTTYRWQYFGIPINTLTASPTFDGSYVRTWDESGTTVSNHWVNVGNSFVLQPGIGYELTQDAPKTIYFQGQLVNWDWTSPQLTKTSTALFPGQHILANPFTAAIDIKKIVFGTDMYAEVYQYSTGSFGDWSAFTNTGNSPGQWIVSTPGTAGTSGIPAQIPSMQGFMVQVNNATSNAYVTIPYSAVVKNTALQRIKEINDSTISNNVSLRIDIAGSKTSDKMWMFTEPTCTRNFDNGWDGPKMLGSALSPQLYAIEPDGEYQIDCLNDMNDTQLGFQAGEDTEYTMTFTQNNLKSKYAGVYLVDQLAKKTIDITESGSGYSFTAISAPSATKRFKIVAINAKDSPAETSSKIKLFSSVGTIFIQNSSNLNGNILIFDIAGHYLEKRPFTPNGITTVSGFVPGIYIAKAITNSEEVTKKMIVR